jgi:hypothetical protein
MMLKRVSLYSTFVSADVFLAGELSQSNIIRKPKAYAASSNRCFAILFGSEHGRIRTASCYSYSTRKLGEVQMP